MTEEHYADIQGLIPELLRLFIQFHTANVVVVALPRLLLRMLASIDILFVDHNQLTQPES